MRRFTNDRVGGELGQQDIDLRLARAMERADFLAQENFSILGEKGSGLMK
jgi:hypothetical protein